MLRLIILQEGRPYPLNPEPCSNMPGGEPTLALAFLEGAVNPGNIS
jgi:hypothetical protein